MDKNSPSGKIFDWKVFKKLFQFIKPYKIQFFSLVFLIMFTAAIAPIIPLLVREAIDGPAANGDYSGLSKMLLLMISFLFFQSILQFSSTFLAGWLGQNIIRDIRVKLYHKILHLKLKFFDDTPIGQLVTRTISDIETLADVFSEGLASIGGDILQLILMIFVMFYTDWRLSIIVLLTVPFMLISTYIFKEKVKSSFNEVRNAVANLNSFVQEHITGMSIVQIFNSEAYEYSKFKEINKEHRKANIKSILYYSIYYPVADVISALAIGLIVWFGAKEIINSEITYGTVTAFIMFTNIFFRPIRMLADRMNTLQMGIVSTDRILKLLESDDYIANNGKNSKNIEGEVTFENVWFAYKDENYVLKNINFKANKGETIAFVGATGAGKSSIINLLSRFYEINKGVIKVDNTNVEEFELGSLRQQIGVVLQDVFLFSDSIENNITLGDKSISREKIIEAAKLVGVHDFIMQLPQNYDYNVMERGATLSVGQRQLISFVRAMVQNPKIIVLDEATSSVDTETEELIQNAIEKLMKGRTSIVIAHRLSTIQKADKIIVVDKGNIVEEGNHEALIEKNGFYANLYQTQYKDLVAA
jgi:ATP-binding cassette, subfamily B, multidrug efflux pump